MSNTPIICTSAHPPKRARCQEMATELVALRAQVATLTAERDSARADVELLTGHRSMLLGDRSRLEAQVDALDTAFVKGGG